MDEQTPLEGVAPPPLESDIVEQATVLGMCVRNALEGTLHGGELGDLSLTDEQMSRLNPIVRNAIATGLHAVRHYRHQRSAREYLGFQARLVPRYWEPPELLQDYTELWQLIPNTDDDLGPTCRRCGRRIIDISRTGERPRWTHLSADDGLNVGCRAASFIPGSGWDDDLPREWKAAPKR